MAFWVNIQNGKVTQCRDTDPMGDPDWIPAIEVRPTLVANQKYGDHYFDITKRPVEIVWPAVAMTAADTAGAIASLREQKKAARAVTVGAITVTTAAGHTFDGDEVSQTRMVRAIVALQATATPNIAWVLSNNTAIQATAAELTEALALAGAAQAAVWVL